LILDKGQLLCLLLINVVNKAFIANLSHKEIKTSAKNGRLKIVKSGSIAKNGIAPS